MTSRRESGAKRMLNRLASLRQGGIVEAAPIADEAGVIDQDHPLVRTLGAERAADLLDGAFDRRVQALDRRRTIEEMSRAGRRVRDIAAATGLSERHVVYVRSDLGMARRR